MKKGFITYRDPEGGVKLHFRWDSKDLGVLIINSAKVVYLNRTAAFYVEQMLKGIDPGKVAKKAVRKFKGLTLEKAKRDYEEIVYKINSLIMGDVCPVTYLGLERIDPLTFETRAPFRVDLAVTYGCNNRCIHCYSASPRTLKNELNTKRWKRAILKLFKVGVPNVVFTGGEPTLRSDLNELISYAENLGMVTGLVTNGRKLSNKRYLDTLLEAGLDYIQVTLESHRPEIHDEITQVKGSWKETIQGIRNILDAGVYLDVNMTLSKLNCMEVEEYVDFLHELGVRNVSANRLIYSGKGLEVKEWFEPTMEETKMALEVLSERTQEYGMRFRWYGVTRYCELNPLEMGLGLKFCSACSITLAIEPDGTVIPCQSYYHPLGNILKDKWDKIWHNPLCEAIRKRSFAGEVCRECPFLQSCGGGCPLEAKIRPFNMKPSS
ncbi:MAG: radical SAM protein [Thermoproteales archaeon]|nr:radical SAM protein [Thermoproteales archaeon]